MANWKDAYVTAPTFVGGVLYDVGDVIKVDLDALGVNDLNDTVTVEAEGGNGKVSHELLPTLICPDSLAAKQLEDSGNDAKQAVAEAEFAAEQALAKLELAKQIADETSGPQKREKAGRGTQSLTS